MEGKGLNPSLGPSHLLRDLLALFRVECEQPPRILQLVTLLLEVKLERAGGNCIKIGLPGKLILSKRKGLREVLFS